MMMKSGGRMDVGEGGNRVDIVVIGAMKDSTSFLKAIDIERSTLKGRYICIHGS